MIFEHSPVEITLICYDTSYTQSTYVNIMLPTTSKYGCA